MTLERAEAAFERAEPIIYKGTQYSSITAIIKRRKKLRSLSDRMTPQSKYVYSCEILDARANSVVICKPEDIQPVFKEN